jgi:hypothetical protein
MKANISIGECIIRIVGGMIFAGIFGGLFTGYVALIGVLAIYPIVTGLGGWDPIFGAIKKYTNEDSPYEEHTPEAVPTSAPVQRARPEMNAAA